MVCKIHLHASDHPRRDTSPPLHQRHNACRRRLGSLLIEMVVCTMLLSVVAVVLVPGIYAVHQQRMHARAETLTLIELNNVASRLRRADSNKSVLSEWFTARYPDSKLEVIPISPAAPAASSPEQPQALRLRITRPAPEGMPPWHRDLVVWKAGTNPINDKPDQAANIGRDSSEQENAE